MCIAGRVRYHARLAFREWQYRVSTTDRVVSPYSHLRAIKYIVRFAKIYSSDVAQDKGAAEGIQPSQTY
jgi:hypothetical protein